jgi:hypothetical protein
MPNALFGQCPMPNAQCPMPNALRGPMPNAQCPARANAQCPMPNAQLIISYKLQTNLKLPCQYLLK